MLIVCAVVAAEAVVKLVRPRERSLQHRKHLVVLCRTPMCSSKGVVDDAAAWLRGREQAVVAAMRMVYLFYFTMEVGYVKCFKK